MNGRLAAGLLLAGLVFLVVAGDALAQHVLAQSAGPFGVGRPPPPTPPPPDGLFAWIAREQAAFYRQLAGAIRAARADGSAYATLAGLAFAYGVFHAAGPGHGKAVISSYVLADGRTAARGIGLAFASAAAQAVTAVTLVGVISVLAGATARTMGQTVSVIETVAYALIVAIGLRLLWVKGRGLVTALAAMRAPVTATASSSAPGGAECGHAHLPPPEVLVGPDAGRRALAAIVAVGLRPCTGAIVVLVFALAQGMFLAGVAATFVMAFGTGLTVAVIALLAVGAKRLAVRLAANRTGLGTVTLRGVEVLGALLVTAFGALLLGGVLASEPLLPF